MPIFLRWWKKQVCASLDLGVEPASTQIVQRDRHAHFVSTLALIACSLDKFATEIRHLQKSEVLEVEEPFSLDKRALQRCRINAIRLVVKISVD